MDPVPNETIFEDIGYLHFSIIMAILVNGLIGSILGLGIREAWKLNNKQ